MEPTKTIEVIAKRTKLCGKDGQGKPINFEVGGNSPQGNSPILLYFYNSASDLPFLKLKATPDTSQWEPNEPYNAGYTQLPLDMFYDNGNGSLNMIVGESGTPVYIDAAYVFDDASTASVAYEFNVKITSEDTFEKAEYRPPME